MTATFCLFCVVWVVPALRQQKDFAVESISPVILSLWHVESFEGGLNSRTDWLKKRAMEFEKKNKGVYVDVSKLTYQQVVDKLMQGQRFDLISFGVGVGDAVLNRLAEISTEKVSGVLQNLLDGGKVAGKQYALPYSSGGYLLAGRKSDLQKVKNFSSLKENVFDCSLEVKKANKSKRIYSVVVGSSAFCCPIASLATLAKRETDSNAFFCQESITQYGAYEKFLYGDTATLLLGSQRDYWRLSSREKNGKIGEILYCAVGGYSDLTQYIAIGETGDFYTQSHSQDFADFLLSQNVQAKLVATGTLSVLEKEIYADGVMKELQDSLKTVATPCVFVSQGVLKQIEDTAKKAIASGQKELLKKYLPIY